MTAVNTARSLHNQLLTLDSLEEKLAFLAGLETVKIKAQQLRFLHTMPPEKKALFLLLLALHQEHLLEDAENYPEKVEKLGDLLLTIEQFYKPIGGCLGYHLQVLELMQKEDHPQSTSSEKVAFLPPPFFDLRVPSKDLLESIQAGIRELPHMGEIYPVGGAGDRMNLMDEALSRPLPVACLQFLGRTLLELLIRDLEAREYLYNKLFSKKYITPIVLMTSEEKMNDKEILAILEKNSWFGRGRENFFRFEQPLVPVITIDGKWALSKPLEPLLKPGGHGVIWKLAIDSHAFDWLEKKGRKAVLVRQINNPLAGLDSNLLAHFGYGRRFNRAFGFFSCPRKPGAQEGMNVLMVTPRLRCLTNIEYTEFSRFGTPPRDEAYPANTNILFADLQKIRQAVAQVPIPGMLVNMKSTFKDRQGKEVPGARLESTMQNIAEGLDESQTFLLLNERGKTISVAKKSWDGKKSIDGTPEGAFQDLLKANRELLVKSCHFQIVGENPPLFLYHPALGPLYSIIRQKIHHGKITEASELQIEAQCVSLTHLDLAGSLLIQALDPARVTMHHVKIDNAGIDRSAPNTYWKNEIKRKEALSITLEGNSSFHAENIEFEGNFDIVVPDGMQAEALRGADGQVEIKMTPLTKERAWSWDYKFNEEGEIILSRCYMTILP